MDALARRGDRFLVASGDLRFDADNVVVAMSSDLTPWTPPFASQLDARVVQLHSYDYRNPCQLQDVGTSRFRSTARRRHSSTR